MNRLPLILFFFFQIGFCPAQSIEAILNSNTNYIKHFQKTDLKENQFYLESPFANGELHPDSSFNKIKSSVIYKIELVYTTYKESQKFNQQELNATRLSNLKKLAPDLFKNDLIEWGQVAITGAQNSEEGKQLFHGFIFTYRETASKETTKKEIAFLKKIISDSAATPTAAIVSDGKQRTVKMAVYKDYFYDEITPPQYVGGYTALNEYLKRNARYPKDNFYKERGGIVKVQFLVDKNGKVNNVKLISGIDEKLNNIALKAIEQMPVWIPGTRNKKTAGVLMKLDLTFIPENKNALIDSIPLIAYRDYRPHGRIRETVVDSVVATETYVKFLQEQDSVVFKVLQRNHWSNFAFICDVTGSMTPFSSQVLLWLKMNIQKNTVKHFLFFNDGDGRSDQSKQVGRVGGLYHLTSTDFTQVTNTMFECMEHGSGGDTPENNIEAALEAVKLFPDCDTLVMIADNFATPRDLELLNKLKKPIKLILCGTYSGINIDYLNMIRKNGGSLHTIEEDIFNLSKIIEGESIEIDGNDFKIENGEFVKAKKI